MAGESPLAWPPAGYLAERLSFSGPDTDTGKFGDPPEKILEIATDVWIKETYGVKDGDTVEVEVF